MAVAVATPLISRASPSAACIPPRIIINTRRLFTGFDIGAPEGTGPRMSPSVPLGLQAQPPLGYR